MHSDFFHGFVFLAGALVWWFGIYGNWLKRFVAPPLLVTVAGIVFGLWFPQPQAQLLGQLESLSWLALGFGVMGIALRISMATARRMLAPATVIVLVAMAGMWATSAAIVGGLTGVGILSAVLLGAIVTPTDPVVASSITTGPFARRNIPPRIRRMLSLESGANDGLAFIIVFLPILLIQHGGQGWAIWGYRTVLCQVVAAGAMGALIGWAAELVFARAAAREHVGERMVMLSSLALTVAVLGLMKLLGVDSIWAVFVAGLMFTRNLGERCREPANQFQEGGLYLAMVPALLLFGMALPWQGWAELGWAGPGVVALLLLVRRLPVIAVLFALMRHRGEPGGGDALRHPFSAVRDLWFYGWFGPLGLSAIYYATTAHRLLRDDTLWAVASLCIFASIVVHGLTAAPFTRWYRRHASEADDGGRG
ncbi:MAG: cation:proton antiporter [Acetobacterales bacterium]